MTAFCSVGQLWYESRVSWRLKRRFFIGRVVNTAPSGIEAFCPSKAQYQSLKSLVLSSQEGDGRSSGEKGGSWACPAPCEVEARVRRLKWAQTLVQDPSHHTQLITAMFGKLPSEPNPTPFLVANFHQRPIRGRCGGWQIWKSWSRMMRGESFSERVGTWGLFFWFANWLMILSQLMLRYYDCGRWRSRSHRGIFGKRRVTQWNCRRKEFHSGGAALTNSVRLGSSRSRIWQRMCCGITDKWRWCLDR